MSVLHIYNPSHEMAMADNSYNFQASKRVVVMENQLAALPLWWSGDGDAVLVPDKRGLKEWYAGLSAQVQLPTVRWITPEECFPGAFTEIEPWGWNKSLGRKAPGIKDVANLSPMKLDEIRLLSSRATAVRVLATFPACEDWVGESYYCTSETEIDEALSRCSVYVLKALWSSSGRGVMMLQSVGSEQSRKLCSSFLKHGGGLVIEPQYDKVQDFAMEFWSDGKGSVTFAGLSFFNAEYGRYASNWVAPQPVIRDRIKIDNVVLGKVQHHLEKVLSLEIGNSYTGPLGVDMMVVHHEGKLKVHPCVEINLRRNMGWVVLSVYERLLHPDAQGLLVTDYQQPGLIFEDHQHREPAVFENGRMKSGYLALTPVFPETQFRIYLQL